MAITTTQGTGSRRHRNRETASVLAVTAAVLMLVLSACSPSPSGGESAGTTEKPEQSFADWQQELDDCLADAGIEVPKPNAEEGIIGAPQGDPDVFAAAYKTCVDDLGPAPVNPDMPSEEDLFESQLIFAKCMRDAGYDYPDPVKGSNGAAATVSGDIDAKILEECSAQAEDGTGK